jgi:hypothetical protein
MGAYTNWDGKFRRLSNNISQVLDNIMEGTGFISGLGKFTTNKSINPSP